MTVAIPTTVVLIALDYANRDCQSVVDKLCQHDKAAWTGTSESLVPVKTSILRF
jgi:hypothetical protein